MSLALAPTMTPYHLDISCRL